MSRIFNNKTINLETYYNLGNIYVLIQVHQFIIIIGLYFKKMKQYTKGE